MSAPLLFVPSIQSEESVELGLPTDSDNIFQRIIRNPHVESGKPRERECTEMLCSVLRNSHTLRLQMLRWMGQMVGQLPEDLDNLDYRIDTERSIGSKRDDLRIEGWRVSGDGQELVLLWTVEVKVGAFFHESSFQDTDDPIIDKQDEVRLVNQLENYDRWLQKQPAEHLAGFVLAIGDLTHELPPNLVMPWHCMTWTSIGRQISTALQDGDLSPSEDLLAKHILGFIMRHLWRVSDMSNDRIDFDDIAVIRAFSTMGIDCERKVNQLVGQLTPVIEDAALGVGTISQMKSLFKPTLRSGVSRSLFEQGFSTYPNLILGVEREYVTIFLETAPGNDAKKLIHRALTAVEETLSERNPDWHVLSLDDGSWQDVELKMPLANLLAEVDQQTAFQEFFRKGLDDLKQAGVVEAIWGELQPSPSE